MNPNSLTPTPKKLHIRVPRKMRMEAPPLELQLLSRELDGYKNSICIDVDHGFIRRYAVTPANVHDSQMLSRVLDPENEHDCVWVDSAHSGECFEDLLSLGGFESLIHEKGARNHPLSDDAKELNRIKSAIRACVEHVFGSMTMSLGGKLTRCQNITIRPKLGLASDIIVGSI